MKIVDSKKGWGGMSEASYLDDGADYLEYYADEDAQECEDCRRWTCLECPFADI